MSDISNSPINKFKEATELNTIELDNSPNIDGLIIKSMNSKKKSRLARSHFR